MECFYTLEEYGSLEKLIATVLTPTFTLALTLANPNPGWDR